MPDSVTLDLHAIHDAQRACGVAWRKRGRALRDAQALLATARAAWAEAGRQVHAAGMALEQAHRARHQAVAACAGARHGGDMAARLSWCEHSAAVVAGCHAALARAHAAVAQAQAQLEARSRETLRAERLLQQAAETVEQWRSREQLAIETHADLALEDEPQRRPS
jgi:hypothetical protein